MRKEINDIKSKERFEKIKSLEQYCEIYPVVDTNCIFINPEGEVIMEGKEIYNFVYNTYYLNDKLGEILTVDSEDILDITIEDQTIYVAFKQQIGDKVVMSHGLDNIVLELGKIEIVKYSELSERKDLISLTGYNISFLKKLIRKLLPGKYRTSNISGDSLLWVVTFNKKEHVNQKREEQEVCSN